MIKIRSLNQKTGNTFSSPATGIRWILGTFLFVFTTGIGAQDGWKYHFSGAPIPDRIQANSAWKFEGDDSLFSITESNHGLLFQWNTEKPNSGIYFPLGFILDERSRFKASVHFRLRSLNLDFVPGSFYGFQLALGFIDSRQVFKENYRRGTGVNSPDLYEWNYFPDTGFGATISPTIVDSESKFFPTFNFPIEVPLGEVVEVTLEYVGDERAMYSTLKVGKSEVQAMEAVRLPVDGSFSGNEIDAFSITSYRDFDEMGRLVADGEILDVSIWWTPTLPEEGAAMNVALRAGLSGLNVSGGLEEFVDGSVRLWRSRDLVHWEFVTSAPGNELLQGAGFPLPSLTDTGTAAVFYMADYIPN